MDFDTYVAARYGRLIEHAVLLGCAEGEAGPTVDRVLLDQRRSIRRAEDPDPMVRAALERELSGVTRRRPLRGPLAAVAVVAMVVAASVALTYRPAPEPMPSLFALQGAEAERLLEERGYDVVLRPARACEPMGLVLGSTPAVGEPVRDGATVTVRTAVPSGVSCEAEYLPRSDAWTFVGFALGGAPPEFAETVRVVVDGAEPASLWADPVAETGRWEEVLEPVREVARRSALTSTGMPALRVDSSVPAGTWCGAPQPLPARDTSILRVEVDTRTGSDDGFCPLAVDLHRRGRVIEAVVVHPARERPAVEPTGLRPAGPTY